MAERILQQIEEAPGFGASFVGIGHLAIRGQVAGSISMPWLG